MSLGVVVKGTEGLALAADSRVTLQGQQKLPNREPQPFTVNYDNANKVITFSDDQHSFVSAITFGEALIGQRTAHSFVPEIEIDLPDQRMDTAEYARHLSEFYTTQWSKRMPPEEEYEGAGMNFVVVGYDDGEPYGRIFGFNVPGDPEPTEQNKSEFGITYGGEAQVVNRLVKGMDPQLVPLLSKKSEMDPAEIWKEVDQQGLPYSFPYEVLPLQDCLDLAILLVRTTIDFQGLAIGTRGVGGKIEAATVTRTDGVSFVQRKQIKGEQRHND
jgi:hypothetical protein